jgi:hypothetical protein
MTVYRMIQNIYLQNYGNQSVSTYSLTVKGTCMNIMKQVGNMSKKWHLMNLITQKESKFDCS